VASRGHRALLSGFYLRKISCCRREGARRETALSPTGSRRAGDLPALRSAPWSTARNEYPDSFHMPALRECRGGSTANGSVAICEADGPGRGAIRVIMQAAPDKDDATEDERMVVARPEGIAADALKI